MAFSLMVLGQDGQSIVGVVNGRPITAAMIEGTEGMLPYVIVTSNVIVLIFAIVYFVKMRK